MVRLISDFVIRMFDLFRKQPADWLKDYPVYAAPHVGLGVNLSEEQAYENLDYLLVNKSMRLDALSKVLKHANIDFNASYNSDSPIKLIDELYQWCGKHWESYIRNDRTRDQWLKSNRAQKELIYSVAMDTAIALGELTIQHRPSYAWGVDIDQGNILMTTWRRCVVMAPIQGYDHMAIADVEHAVVERLINPSNSKWQWENQWQKYLHDYINGAHEGAHLVP